MVSIKKKTQDNPRDVYGKYELDLFEREYIESLIKPME